jgi:molybdate transport system substrate-binding protein
MRTLFRLAFVLALFTAAGLRAIGAEVKVFAAASLTDAMQAIARDYEAQSHDQIVFNFAGSNVLARQILQGAPADIFLSADEREMDVVEKADMLAIGSRRNLLSNTLVVIVPAGSSLTIQSAKDLTKNDVKRIALGDPETVPAGVYAKSYLTSHGIWLAVQNKVIPTENVRAALAAVASGNVEAGIVYKTDAMISPKIKIAFEIPTEEAPQILYPGAIVKNSTNSQEVKNFFTYLESSKAAAVFAHYGFRTTAR